MRKELDITTKILHADRYAGTEANAVHKPIHISNQYAFERVEGLIGVFQNQPGFSYSRQGTPTSAALENKITLLEEGVSTIGFASGMAALSAVFTTLLKSGDHLIASRFVFGNTKSLFMTLEGFGIEITLVDTTDIKNVEAALQDNTRMLFTETIANPVTQVSDLKGMGDFCEKHNLVYFVDNTMITPYLLKGKDIKASLVMHSLSKGIGGHASALGGSVTNTGLYNWTDYPNIIEGYKTGPSHSWGLLQIKKKGLRDMGATLAADSASRISLGIETLSLRMEKAFNNALQLAQYMERSPIFSAVKYPGLTAHPQHERAKELFAGKGYGALLAVELNPAVDLFSFLNHLKVVILATHLGDNRTLCLPVAPTIYNEMTPELRAEMGISDSLLRVSVGIEDVEDIIADFEQAYEKSLNKV